MHSSDENDEDIEIEKCQICDGTKKTFNKMSCFFCNETGLRSKFSDAFFKNHICLCSLTDKKKCPICKKKCHHDSSLKPKILITPGSGTG